MSTSMAIDRTTETFSTVGESIREFFANMRDSVVDFWNEHEIGDKLVAFFQ